MKAIYLVVLTVLIGFGINKEANAMRCDGKIVRVGDSVYKLIKNCGRPLAISYGDWGMTDIYTYEIYGREQSVIIRNGKIVGGV